MDRSQALLWIKGKPGAGKSTLMEFLYNELKGLSSLYRNSISVDLPAPGLPLIHSKA
jgi:adenylylsulfate kinase-like enzyme